MMNLAIASGGGVIIYGSLAERKRKPTPKGLGIH